MKTAYVANCNLPNHFAHAMQIMKNAQAWHRNSDEFKFVSNLSLKNWLGRDTAKLNRFYGISDPFDMKLYPLLDVTGKRWSPVSESFYRSAAQYLKDWGAELVFTRTFVLPKYSLDLGLPTIVETHGLPEGSADKEALFKRLEEDLFVGIVTISEALRDRYIAYGLPAEKILVAPDGADLSMFAKPLDRETARNKLGYEGNGQYALYVGHLYDDRGILEILGAAKQMPQVNFVIVGGHPGDVERWRLRVANSKYENVEITGFVENHQVPDYLWMADVLLMPYSTTCPTAEWMSPLKLFEYMAAGRPIIATDLNAIKRVLQHRETGYLVEPDSTDSLLAGLQTVLADNVLQQSLSLNTLREVKGLSWESRVRTIIEFANR
jgi:glycosyltransferase involved in cell wall biosynthesis